MSQKDVSIDEPREGPVQRYHDGTETSRDLYRRACQYMPGGNTRDAVFYSPYPAYIEAGEGCYVRDVDGNEHLDFVNNMTSLIHGHAPEVITEAAQEAIHSSSAPGGPTRAEIDWAEHLCERVPGLDKVRFTNSGTEATMNVLRAARAYTGNDLIAKFEGVYHGTNDDAQISVHPPEHLAGPERDPNSVPDSAGLPNTTPERILTLPFNDPGAALAGLDEHRSDLAGVLVAPLMGSAVIPATNEFISRIEEFTTGHDVPLIFDEVISFRIAHGGSHVGYGVEPDLMTFGKLIGGGFPVGAFGGREELMAGYDPRGGSSIVHSGTFNANPVTAAAGLAALEAYDQAAVSRINELGARLEENTEAVIDDHDLPIQVQRVGSLFNIYLTAEPVEDYRDAIRTDEELQRRIHMELLDEGMRVAPKLMGAISTPMAESEIDEFVDSFDATLDRVRPAFEVRTPVD